MSCAQKCVECTAVLTNIKIDFSIKTNIAKSTHHHNNGRLLPIDLHERHPHEHPEQTVRGQRRQVAHVPKALHQRDGAHGPVAAQVTWEQQQPQVHRGQVVVRELARGRRRHRGRIVEPEGGKRTGKS